MTLKLTTMKIRLDLHQIFLRHLLTGENRTSLLVEIASIFKFETTFSTAKQVNTRQIVLLGAEEKKNICKAAQKSFSEQLM